MARVIYCAFGHPNPEDGEYCSRPDCRIELGPAAHGPAAGEAPRDEAAGAPPVPRAPPASTTTAALAFEWGDVVVTGRLPVGRDPDFSPLAENLARYGHVSRRHAVVTLDPGGLLEVEDLSSTHGTTLKGRRVKPGVRHLAMDGDTIEFSRGVVARVRLGRGR